AAVRASVRASRLHGGIRVGAAPADLPLGHRPGPPALPEPPRRGGRLVLSACPAEGGRSARLPQDPRPHWWAGPLLRVRRGAAVTGDRRVLLCHGHADFGGIRPDRDGSVAVAQSAR